MERESGKLNRKVEMVVKSSCTRGKTGIGSSLSMFSNTDRGVCVCVCVCVRERESSTEIKYHVLQKQTGNLSIADICGTTLAVLTVRSLGDVPIPGKFCSYMSLCNWDHG